MENNSNANFVNIFACVFKGKALGTTLGILLWRGRGRGRGRQLFMGGGQPSNTAEGNICLPFTPLRLLS